MLLSLALVSVLAADPCAPELFRIERSKNANVVLYEAKLTPAGALDGENPVTASWLMLAAKGERESLTFLEKRMAYGFEVSAVPEGGFALRLKALQQRTIRIAQRDGCAAATSTIGGHDAVLKRIYVKADDRALIPSVQYVEIFGIDTLTGDAVYEKIVLSPLPATSGRGPG